MTEFVSIFLSHTSSHLIHNDICCHTKERRADLAGLWSGPCPHVRGVRAHDLRHAVSRKFIEKTESDLTVATATTPMSQSCLKLVTDAVVCHKTITPLTPRKCLPTRSLMSVVRCSEKLSAGLEMALSSSRHSAPITAATQSLEVIASLTSSQSHKESLLTRAFEFNIS